LPLSGHVAVSASWAQGVFGGVVECTFLVFSGGGGRTVFPQAWQNFSSISHRRYQRNTTTGLH